MLDLLPPWPLLSAFLVASTVLALTPGPAVLYIVARSVSQGRRAGLSSVTGVALGNLCNALGAAVGLAALFAASSLAFTVVKYAGALYLIFLGLQMLRASGRPSIALSELPVSTSRVFRDGFVVALLNPKTTLFYAAFLPQFMTPSAAPIVQSALLGCIFVAIAAGTDVLYALGAGRVAESLSARGRLGRGLRAAGGGIFVGLGVFTAAMKSGVER
ncbi:MAG: LysE family translocator [Burkholderiales bacterium]|nr:LysE family translocator [Burkholderiales bacterium]